MKWVPLSLLLVLAALLLNVVATGAQGPALSPTVFLPGDAANGLAAYDQQEPFIAQGANSYLAVWTDTRSDGGRRSGSYYGGGGSDIYAARVDTNGVRLDAVPIIVSEAPADQRLAQAAWNGQSWLVVWLSQEPAGYFWSWSVMAARVSPAGVLLDPQPLRLTTANVTEVAVGSDGTNWVVVWEGNSAGDNDVVGTVVTAAGVALNPGGRLILAGDYYMRYNLDIAFAGDEYLLTWQGINTVEGKRLRLDLTAIDATYFTIAPYDDGSLSNVRVASDGTSFFVVWEENVSTTYYQAVKGARVSHAVQVLDTPAITIWEDYGGYSGREPDVAWGGTNWFVSFMLNGITVLRLSPAGALLDPNDIPADFDNTSNKWMPASSPAFGGGIRLVWQDTRAGGQTPGDIYTASVSASRVMGNVETLSMGAPSQNLVSAAANGSGYMLAFRSDVSGSQRIKAQLLDGNGVALMAAPVQLASGPSLGPPAIAWNGTYFLVVWRGSDQIYGRRLRADGSLVEGAPFAIMPGHSPEVAALGDTFLVVSVHAPSNPQFQFPFVVRVRGSDGVVLRPATQVGQYFANAPDVTVLGNRWLVVWQRNASHDDAASEIQANFIDASGTPAGEFTVRTNFTGVRFHYNPAVAASGDTALVIWEDPRVSNTDWNLYGRRIAANGSLLDPWTGVPIVTAPGNQRRASLSWDGGQFLAVYEDNRAVTYFMDSRTDIYASRITAAGVPSDPTGFAVFNQSVPEIYPAVASANGASLLTAAIFRDSAPFLAYRVGHRVLGGGAIPPTATATAPAPTATAVPPTATATSVPPKATATATAAPPTATATTAPPTSTTVPPTATTAPPTATAAPPTATATAPPVTVTPSPIPPSGAILYVSSSTGGTAGGVAFADEDILAYNISSRSWSLYFDGSDVGLAATNLDAFTFAPDGSLLLSLAKEMSLSGVGLVSAADIIRFVPASLGPTTAGSFAWYFDGSDVGLATTGEDIDAVALAPDGRLLLSGSGAVRVTGVVASDEDLLAFTPTALGATTAGAWALYFDGSDVGLVDTSEDLWGAWLDSANGDLYLTTQGAFSVPGSSGDGADIFICHPITLGDSTACAYGPGLFWDGSANGFAGEVIDGFVVKR
jgi:hypothetical protein